jgi:DNA helicase-2/ATP-dependent DNA helicase PcrA
MEDTMSNETNGRVWSQFQKDIFAEVASNNTTNIVVLARAGSGKTTTVVEAMKYVPKGRKILFVAFNKRIQEELASRVPAGVEAKTLHALGLRAVKAVFPRIQVDADAEAPVIADAIDDAYRAARPRLGFAPDTAHDPTAKNDLHAVKKLTSLAKNTLAETVEEIGGLMVDHDIWPGYLTEEEIAAAVKSVLDTTRKPGKAMSFDDMVWLPVVLGLAVPKYDVLFVDEAQDLNQTQIALIQMACKGRIVAVGDDRQAIYGFRGAAQNAIPALVSGLGATTLPLSISYRCAQEIVRAAQQIVADIQPAPSAPVGKVWQTNEETMLNTATPGDFILSRTNAAAVSACIGLLRKGTPATVVGRDIGASICKMVVLAQEKGGVYDLDGLVEWTHEWLRKTTEKAVQRAKRLHRNADATVQSADDRATVLLEIAAASSDLNDLIRKLSSLFSDDDRTPRVCCSTVHKAKGLEANRVWVLIDTWKRAGGEEDNLRYVAVTRAKLELALVRSNVR